ncbi:TonB-dependent receptor domain-containing protein [Sphingobium boeckii]|uniref:Outer membrane receptor protein involved in Fe transport n=1 Tax=Sphingobium boeckii TaxID=1082345 RepID=A0A7W9AFZ6_9SPHN|nr:TonB-dependent receptor [Sphingobium boeckii]MBB5684883.1 outer membrane receptor protein involved in Fe transport [Sphingobium boeckii]
MTDMAYARQFNIPPGRLGDVAAALGERGGITIAVADPDLADRHSPGVRGNLSMRAALAQALHGTGTEAVFYDSATARIVRQRAVPPPRIRPAPKPVMPVDVQTASDIIVTASKQNILLDTYPGSVKLLELEPGWLASNAAGGTAAITKLLPTLGSTNLGPARNKLFIRGIADSSFNGPTQATVGQYLGDVRLNYNAPDPNLNLYDMKRIEVLVGPQGALYGASSLGGIIRLVPNAPDTGNASATASAGIGSTRFGGLGGDGAAMFNLPVVDGRIAVRFVTFATREGGYIDDPSRGLRDINSTTSYGQRMTWRIENFVGLTVDLGVAVHNTTTRDGQYTLRGDTPLTRSNALSQPFKNTYYLAYFTARRMLGRAELVSTTSIVRHDLKTVFDATGSDGSTSPARFEEDNNIMLISHETRISGGGQKAPWVAGIASIYNASALSRSLGKPDDPVQITGVLNQQAEAAVFGQLSRPLTSTLTGTIGGRLTFAHSAGNLLDNPLDKSNEPSRNELRFSGTLALDWHPSGPFSAFFHYQQGNRAGGLAVAPSGSALESRKFAADDLSVSEIGIRLGDKEQDRLSIRAAIFFTDWNHIQADLIDNAGLPYTTNIGSGRIFGLDGEIIWRLSPALTVTAAAFLNNSDLYAPEPEFATLGERTLPNIPRNGSRVAVGWRKDFAPGINLNAEASLRFVGKSRLGAGSLLDIPQGDYAVGDVGAQLDFGRFGVSLDVANVGDVRANSFAFGNPFGMAQRDQMTPLRPRTVRLGINARF